MPALPFRPASSFALSKHLITLCAGFMCTLALSNAVLPAALGQASSAPAVVPKAPQTTVAPAAGPTVPPPSTSAHGKGAHEGIKVNGYWKIDVRNADGTLDKHVEFENSLTTNEPYTDSGDYALSTILAGASMMGDPGIAVNVLPGPNYLVNNTAFLGFLPDFSQAGPCGGVGCMLSTPSSLLYNDCLRGSAQGVTEINEETSHSTTISSASCFNTLTLSHSTVLYLPIAPASSQVRLQLQGNFTASTSGNVSNVASIVTFCQFGGHSGSSPAYCAVPSGTALGSFVYPFVFFPITFTSYTLPTPLSVSVGQAVNISVTLTFN